jgi:ribosome-associated protein
MAKTNASAVRAPRTARTPTAGKTAAASHAKPPAARAQRARSGAARLPVAVATAVSAARDRKAVDVVVLDLRKAGGFTDFFVICTVNNPRQITAIADAVRETLKKELGERPTLAEGVDRSEWILLDYFNFVVHVFSRECRSFYALERLWGNAERIEFPNEE